VRSTADIESNKVISLIAIAALALLATLIAGHALVVIQVAENWVGDIRVATLTPRQPQSSEIIVVTVNEETLSRLPYRSPVDREFLSELLRTLAAKNVRAIGMDMLFDQPTESAKDTELRRTLLNLSVPVVVGWGTARDGLTQNQMAFMQAYLEGILRGTPAVIPDRVDGVVRSLLLTWEADGVQASLVAALAKTLGLQLLASETLALRYRSGPDALTPAFASYPAHTVALLPDEWLDGKIVIVGADMALTDRLRTPFSVLVEGHGRDMAGVLIHAHALSQIVEQADDLHVSFLLTVALMLALGFAGAAIPLLSTSLVAQVITIPIALVAVWIAGFAIYQQEGPLLPLVVPTLTFVVAAGLAYIWHWHREHAEKRFIRTAFSKLVAPAVVDYITADPRRLHLEGERRDMTFLFTDIAGFTTLTEHTEPMVLVRTMNEYLDQACRIVFAHGGTVQQIVGDALHVMFNAPVDVPEHPERAVACALELDNYFQAFAARKRKDRIDFGLTRIGVNTGVTVVGNYGGEVHFEYTATGDVINTTARLESINKQFGTRICIGGDTVARCPSVEFRPIGELVLVGKSEVVAAHEPIPQGDARHNYAQEYETAYRLMAADESTAEGVFDRLRMKHPDDALIQFHARRLMRGETGCRIVMQSK
jgi:class 3 adenylate cyclase